MNKPELEILIDLQLNKALQKIRDAYEASDHLKVERSDMLTLVLDHIETYTHEVRTLRSMKHDLGNVDLTFKHFGDSETYDPSVTTNITEAIDKLTALDDGMGSVYLRYKTTEIIVANVSLRYQIGNEPLRLKFESLPYKHYGYSS